MGHPNVITRLVGEQIEDRFPVPLTPGGTDLEEVGGQQFPESVDVTSHGRCLQLAFQIEDVIEVGVGMP